MCFWRPREQFHRVSRWSYSIQMPTNTAKNMIGMGSLTQSSLLEPFEVQKDRSDRMTLTLLKDSITDIHTGKYDAKKSNIEYS